MSSCMWWQKLIIVVVIDVVQWQCPRSDNLLIDWPTNLAPTTVLSLRQRDVVGLAWQTRRLWKRKKQRKKVGESDIWSYGRGREREREKGLWALIVRTPSFSLVSFFTCYPLGGILTQMKLCKTIGTAGRNVTIVTRRTLILSI